MPRSAKKSKNIIIPRDKIEGKEIIQIVFSSKETERITQSIKESNPTRVYYVLHKYDIHKEFMAENIETIKNNVPKCKIFEKTVDFVNYHEIIALIFDIFAVEIQNPKTQLMINTGTGSKMVAIASFDAYRLLPQNISLFYPFGIFVPNGKGPTQQGTLQAAKPPEFRMKIPNPELIEIIQYIYRCCLFYPKNDRFKRGFVYREEFLDFLEKKPYEKSPSIVIKLLEKLRDDWHYIHFDSSEGGTPIFFTRAGKQIALALRNYPNMHILDDVRIKESVPFVKSESIPFNSEYEPVEENTLGDFLLTLKIPSDPNNEVRQIHITYNVDETERITKPIIESKTQVLYYFWMDGKQKDVYLPRKKENLDIIRKELPKCEIYEPGVDYVDYYQIISKISTIIQKELIIPNTRIQINLGTASKMVAMANMDAFRLFPEKINLIYLYSRDYDPNRDDSQPKHVGKLFNAMVPRFELLLPEKELIQSLQILDALICEQNKNQARAKNEYLQSDWEKELEKQDLLKSDAKKDKNTIRASLGQKFERKYGKPLEKNWNLIKRTSSGKSFKIRFTDEGQKFIEVFRNINLTS